MVNAWQQVVGSIQSSNGRGLHLYDYILAGYSARYMGGILPPAYINMYTVYILLPCMGLYDPYYNLFWNQKKEKQHIEKSLVQQIEQKANATTTLYGNLT